MDRGPGRRPTQRSGECHLQSHVEGGTSPGQCLRSSRSPAAQVRADRVMERRRLRPAGVGAHQAELITITLTGSLGPRPDQLLLDILAQLNTALSRTLQPGTADRALFPDQYQEERHGDGHWSGVLLLRIPCPTETVHLCTTLHGATLDMDNDQTMITAFNPRVDATHSRLRRSGDRGGGQTLTRRLCPPLPSADPTPKRHCNQFRSSFRPGSILLLASSDAHAVARLHLNDTPGRVASLIRRDLTSQSLQLPARELPSGSRKRRLNVNEAAPRPSEPSPTSTHTTTTNTTNSHLHRHLGIHTGGPANGTRDEGPFDERDTCIRNGISDISYNHPTIHYLFRHFC